MRLPSAFIILCALCLATACNPHAVEQEAPASHDPVPGIGNAVSEYETTQETKASAQPPAWFSMFGMTWNENTEKQARMDCESRVNAMSRNNPPPGAQSNAHTCPCVIATMKQLAYGTLKKSGHADNFSYAFARCYVPYPEVPGTARRAFQRTGTLTHQNGSPPAPKLYYDSKTKTWRNR